MPPSSHGFPRSLRRLVMSSHREAPEISKDPVADNTVLYAIKIDNDGDAIEDVTYQFRFRTIFGNPNTFLYNTGPITSLTSPSWNMRQLYSVTRVLRDGGEGERRRTVLGTDLVSPPVRIGPRSTPDYPALA